MRNKNKLKISIITLGIVFALLTINSFNLIDIQGNNDGAVAIRDETNLKSLKKSGFWPNCPRIYILNDNWSATPLPWIQNRTGTYDDPHLIENVTINAGGTGSGIFIENSKEYFIIRNCTVYNAEINWYDAGIKLANTDNGTLTNNNCSNNGGHGIFLYPNCNNNTILGNTANDNDSEGITLVDDCDNNTISGNTANDNGYEGITLLDDCDNNTISGNTANENGFDGILLIMQCNNNTITGNTANDNYCGLTLMDDCDNNTIVGNTVNDNSDTGIIFIAEGPPCEYNDITENILYNNTIGIDLELGNYNLLYENFFMKNGKHAIDDGSDNHWNNTAIGNYWDNWTSPDANNDGIVDNWYTYIGGSADSIDYLPIAEDGAPRITINSPSPGDGFSVTAPSFDVEITDVYVFSRWYTIDGGISNYTFTENGMINQTAWDAMSDGSITLTFYASDIIYQYFHNITHIGSAEVIIIKDTVAPVIVINSPAEGEKFGKKAPSFDLDVTDLNLATIWYSLDEGVTNFTVNATGSIDQTAWDGLSEGSITITFYANDIAGNLASEDVIVTLEKEEVPLVIILIAIISTAAGIGIVTVAIVLLRKRKRVSEVV